MRESVKTKIIDVQASGDSQTTRPPEAAGKRGLWPGHPNPGSFAKGPDPRRSDGPISQAKKASIEAIASAHAETAVAKLLALLDSEATPPAVVEKVANSLLDRAFGKTVDRVAVASMGEGSKPVGSLTRDELMAKLSARYSSESDQESYLIEQSKDG